MKDIKRERGATTIIMVSGDLGITTTPYPGDVPLEEGHTLGNYANLASAKKAADRIGLLAKEGRPKAFLHHALGIHLN